MISLSNYHVDFALILLVHIVHVHVVQYQFFQSINDPSAKVLIHNSLIFQEAKALAKEQGFETEDIKEIALKIADLPKQNTDRSRTVVITQGHNPVIFVKGLLCSSIFPNLYERLISFLSCSLSIYKKEEKIRKEVKQKRKKEKSNE